MCVAGVPHFIHIRSARGGLFLTGPSPRLFLMGRLCALKAPYPLSVAGTRGAEDTWAGGGGCWGAPPALSPGSAELHLLETRESRPKPVPVRTRAAPEAPLAGGSASSEGLGSENRAIHPQPRAHGGARGV